MSVREVMYYLAEYYIYGIVACCVLVVGLYLFISIRLMLSARKEGIDVCVTAMIPIYNLHIPIRKAIVRRKRNQVYSDDDVIEL